MESLLKKINNFSQEDKNLFDRIYEIKVEEAVQYFPESLKDKFKDAEKQKIFIVKNKILNQETYFNTWRAKREEPKKEEISETFYDPFCDPYNNTPYDDLGRLENEKAITASNLAKISKDHSLVIFKEHNKDKISEEDIEKSLELSLKWFEKKESKIRILIWNYGFRAGASIIHPHFQVFSLDSLPFKIDFILNRINEYKNKFNSDYLNDVFEIHRNLGLAKEINNLKVLVNITPFKDNELIFYFKNFQSSIKEISKLLYVYKSLIENFNLLICDSEYIKIGFLVDRGLSSKINSDIGALEIYAFSVVGFDPIDFSNNLFSNFH